MSNAPLHDLIATLRTELEAHGKLFRLLESQRSALLNRDVDTILDASQHLNGQIDSIRELQQARSRQVATLDPEGASQHAGISHCIERITDPVRPLLEELVREINRLITESARQLRRNQMLFRRASDIGQEMIRALNPQGADPDVYRRDGLTRQSAVSRVYTAKTA